MKTRRCGEAEARGRLRKAEQFLESAETIRDLADDEADIGDAFVTLCVHAGIAAADVLCCVALGVHAQGEDHSQAIDLVAKVRPDGEELSKSLRILLAVKTKAGYTSRTVNAADRKRAVRAAERLVTSARDRI
jgi:hypothetical protein